RAAPLSSGRHRPAASSWHGIALLGRPSRNSPARTYPRTLWILQLSFQPALQRRFVCQLRFSYPRSPRDLKQLPRIPRFDPAPRRGTLTQPYRSQSLLCIQRRTASKKVRPARGQAAQSKDLYRGSTRIENLTTEGTENHRGVAHTNPPCSP